jgi:hypothetical protein
VGRRRLSLVLGLAVALLLGAMVFLYAHDPADGDGYPVCVFHELTGLHCPGCGTLRAIHQLLHGHLMAALRLNALSVCLLPVLLVVTARNEIAAWRGVTIKWHRPRWVPAGWRWAIVILIIAFGVLRNVPAWPFSLLAPH